MLLFKKLGILNNWSILLHLKMKNAETTCLTTYRPICQIFFFFLKSLIISQREHIWGNYVHVKHQTCCIWGLSEVTDADFWPRGHQFQEWSTNSYSEVSQSGWSEIPYPAWLNVKRQAGRRRWDELFRVLSLERNRTAGARRSLCVAPLFVTGKRLLFSGSNQTALGLCKDPVLFSSQLLHTPC